MRGLAASAALLSLAVLGTRCEFRGARTPSAGVYALSASAFAKDKPLTWKPIEDALLRVNDAPPKEWAVYRTGKKNEPLLLQIGDRFLLIETHDRRVFELDPSKIERKSGELLWSPTDLPGKPLAASNWVSDDIGAAFVIKFKLGNENTVVDLQLPHPADIGSLPQQAPARTWRR